MQGVGYEYRKGIQYSKGTRGSECYPVLSWGKKITIYMQEFPNNGSCFCLEVRNKLSLQKEGNEN